MTLFIDHSFENLRELIQGYSRVGRRGDLCKRVRFSDVELIDQVASAAYTGRLFKARERLTRMPPLQKIVLKKDP